MRKKQKYIEMIVSKRPNFIQKQKQKQIYTKYPEFIVSVSNKKQKSRVVLLFSIQNKKQMMNGLGFSFNNEKNHDLQAKNTTRFNEFKYQKNQNKLPHKLFSNSREKNKTKK